MTESGFETSGGFIRIGGQLDSNGNRINLSGMAISEYIRRILRSEEQITTEIRIVNAVVSEAIYFGNVSGPDKIIPNIIVENCDIASIDFSYSHCSRVHILNSQLNSVRAWNSVFEFGFCLQGVKFVEGNSEGEIIPPELVLRGASSKKDIAIFDTVLDHNISKQADFSSMEIAGDFLIVNSILASGINVSDSKIGCSLSLMGADLSDTMFLVNSHIHGHLSIQNGSSIRGSKIAIGAEGLRLGGAVLAWDSHFEGNIRFIYTNIGINLEFKNCSILCNDKTGDALELTSSNISGQIMIVSNSRVDGFIGATGCSIGGKVFLHGSSFSCDLSQQHYAVDFSGCHIRGLFSAQDIKLHRGIRLSGSKFESNVAVENVEVRPPTERDKARNISNCFVDMRNIECKGQVIVNIKPQSDIFVVTELGGATIDGLEIPKNINDNVVYSFSGMTSKRILGRSRDAIRHHLNFLRSCAMQMKSRHAGIDPQPFYSASRLLRSSGWSEEADHFIVSYKRLKRRYSWNPLSKIPSLIFDACFGYGYSRWRSAITICVWLCIGTWGTITALKRNVLIVDTQAVSSTVIQNESGASQTSLPVLALGAAGATNIPCGDNIEAVYYAIELMLPIFDLGQRKQCTIRGRESGETGPWIFPEYFWWWLAKYIYVIGGWVIISIGALTISGTLKDRGEE